MGVPLEVFEIGLCIRLTRVKSIVFEGEVREAGLEIIRFTELPLYYLNKRLRRRLTDDFRFRSFSIV